MKKIAVYLLAFGLSFPIWASNFDEGIALLKAGKYDQAKTWFEQANQSGLSHPDLFYALGVAYYYLGEYQNSVNYFKQNQNPERTYPSLFYLGKIAEFQGNYPKAQRYYEQVLYQFEDLEAQSSADAALASLAMKQALGAPEMAFPWMHYGLLSMDLNYVEGVVDPADENLSERGDYSASFMGATGLYYVPKQSQMKYGIKTNFYQESYQDLS